MAGVLLAQCCTIGASAEVCRFAGTTSHDGHVAVTASVNASNGVTRVDVTMALTATMFWSQIHYLVEEISTWRAREMESVAVNTRYLVGDHIVRQQWDAFQRTGNRLQARRVQAKTLADFASRHPGFVQHWDPDTFGSPWLQDYKYASSERRADLDLKASEVPAGLGSPLAMAFYWSRWLPGGVQEAPVFLPGFKADQLVNLRVSTAGPLRRAALQYAALHASTATALTSSDGHLLRLTFDVHGPAGSAAGQIDQQGCEGAPVPPADPNQSFDTRNQRRP